MNALLKIKKAIRFLSSSGPRYGTLVITGRCNRRCPYCTVNNKNQDLPFEIWQEIIDRLASWGVVLFSIIGGEPTLRPDLLRLISHASQKSIVNLDSNGDAFSKRRSELMFHLAGAGLYSLVLTLHQTKDFDKLVAILKQAKSLGIVPILATVATRQNISELPRVMEKANGEGILFRYCFVQTLGGSFSPSENGSHPNQEQISEFVRRVEKQKSESGLIMNLDAYLQTAALYPRGWHCDSSQDHWIHVDYRGRLMACSEHLTGLEVREITSLKDQRWQTTRAKIRQACPGCTYHCHIEQEEGIHGLLREAYQKSIGLLKRR